MARHISLGATVRTRLLARPMMSTPSRRGVDRQLSETRCPVTTQVDVVETGMNVMLGIVCSMRTVLVCSTCSARAVLLVIATSVKAVLLGITHSMRAVLLVKWRCGWE